MFSTFSCKKSLILNNHFCIITQNIRVVAVWLTWIISQARLLNVRRKYFKFVNMKAFHICIQTMFSIPKNYVHLACMWVRLIIIAEKFVSRKLLCSVLHTSRVVIRCTKLCLSCFFSIFSHLFDRSRLPSVSIEETVKVKDLHIHEVESENRFS